MLASVVAAVVDDVAADRACFAGNDNLASNCFRYS